MRNIFTKVFAVAAMMVMSLTVQNAKAATVSDLVAIDHDWAFIADDVTNNGADGLTSGALYADERVISLHGNGVATNKGSNVFSGESHLNCLKIKNADQRIAFKVSGACSVTFYTESNATRGLYVSKTDNVTTDEAAYAKQPAETPIWNVNLDAAGVYYITNYSGDFFIAGFEIDFEEASPFTFGYEATVVDEGDPHTISALAMHADGCEDVTTGSLNANYDNWDNQTVFYPGGNESGYAAASSYRCKKDNSTWISSQEVAESEGAYIGYNLTVAVGHALRIAKISTDIYNIKDGTQYEYVIQNSSDVVLFKSPVQTIVKAKTGTDHRLELKINRDAWCAALSGLQGEIQVKLIFWNSNGNEYVAPAEFKVTGVVISKTSQTKTLNRIDVNGVQYDYENEGNTISTLLHAAPSVKFYYSVTDHWSDGSETAAPDEEETVVASVDGGNYVATTTLASTPYSLTFTNVDLPKVFGITRAVAAETSNSTDMESDGVTPKTQNKYAVSADALVDPSVAHVTISQNYGGRNTLTNSSRSFVWFNGIEAQDCFVDYGELSDRTSSNDFNENQYFGFDLTVYLGYKVSLTELVSDALIEKDKTGLHYLVKIYNNDVEVASMPDVEVTSKGVDMKRVIDLSENAALQDLTGKVTVKMFVYGNSGKYIIVKDLNVSAAVEANPGEGENSFTFVRYDEGTTKYVFNHDGGLDQEKKPTFTDGEVTVYFERADGNKVKTHENNSGSVKMEGGHSITVSVPEDSYISEVEFINNGEGNNVDGIAFNLTITNDVAATVGSLNQQKAGSHIWSCGELRESELTFLQGATGNFYLKSIRVVYLKKDADPDKSFTRTHAHMNLNTLCFPYTVTAYTGGTFYEMLYKRMESSVPVEVVLVEHEGNLVAGTPYFYMPEGSQLDLTYSGHRENTPSKVNGVKGIYDEQTVPSGSYVTYNGEIRLVGSNVTLSEYRAYINMDEVDEESAAPAPAPGKKLLRIRNANAPAVTTDVESIQHSEFSIQKVLHNGQLFIIRDGKVYNAQGKIVK